MSEDISNKVKKIVAEQLGIDEANLMGDILVEKEINFDKIISSSANRAISTARIIKKQIRKIWEIFSSFRLYFFLVSPSSLVVKKKNTKVGKKKDMLP